MKYIKYLLSFIAIYFSINVYLEDYNLDKINIFSLEALLSSLFLILLHVIGFFMVPTKKKGMVILKFLISIVLVVVFYKLTSTYFQKHFGLWSLVALPISFMIIDFIEYGKKNVQMPK